VLRSGAVHDPSHDPAPTTDPTLLHNDLSAEYFVLVDLVTSFDQRLLTIKGWGVTLSLASRGLGFQQDHYGLFLVAAVSGLAFWIVEGTTKLHQMRFYPRMGDIEVAMFALYRAETPAGPVSSPLIDWSWYTSKRRIRGGPAKGDPRVPRRWPDENPLTPFGRLRYHPILFPHVVFPHFVSVAVGGGLFIIGLLGYLGPI
jgi:hypothetical protein